MRHPIIISVATLLIAAIFYIVVDSLSNDSRAAIGSLTVTGLTSLVLFSAYNSNELKKGS
jgi:hypothetical protein